MTKLTDYYENIEKIRAVKTVYSTRMLNSAIKSGLKYEIHFIKNNPKLFQKLMILRNKKTGKIVEATSRFIFTRRSEILKYSEECWDLIYSFKRYIRERNNTRVWGAYILPIDVSIGELLRIEDPLEDVVVREIWDRKDYAEDIVATWDGEKLILDLEIISNLYWVG
jgi:hypothetical protein